MNQHDYGFPVNSDTWPHGRLLNDVMQEDIKLINGLTGLNLVYVDADTVRGMDATTLNSMKNRILGGECSLDAYAAICGAKHLALAMNGIKKTQLDWTDPVFKDQWSDLFEHKFALIKEATGLSYRADQGKRFAIRVWYTDETGKEVVCFTGHENADVYRFILGMEIVLKPLCQG